MIRPRSKRSFGGHGRRPPMRRPEQTLQIHCVQWLSVTVPPPPEGACYFSVENGFKRTKAEAGIGKAMGRRPGVADLILLHRSRAIAIEFKAPGRINDTTDRQDNFRDDWTLAGGVYHAVDSFDDFRALIRVLGIPTRDRMP